MRYLCDDGNAPIEIEADDPTAAAQEYVDGGDWGDIENTTWINVYVMPLLGEPIEGQDHVAGCGEDHNDDEECCGDGERCKISIQPEEPACDDDEHDWRSPHSVLGGLKENPGVWGHGGSVVTTEVCGHCGLYRITDSWAQDMEDGTQGLDSVGYEDANEASRAYVARRKNR